MLAIPAATFRRGKGVAMLAALGFLLVVLTLLSLALALWTFVAFIGSAPSPSRWLRLSVWGGLAVTFAAFVFVQEGAQQAAGFTLSMSGVLGLLWACVGLVSPRLARLPKRWMAVPVTAAAFVLLASSTLLVTPTERSVRSAAGHTSTSLASVGDSDGTWCGNYRAIRADAGGGSSFAEVRALAGSPNETMGGSYRWDLALFGDPAIMWVRFNADDRAVHKRHQGIVDLATGFDC